MHPRYPNLMMHGRFFTAFAIVHWVLGLVVLAGFVCFLFAVWRFVKAHERIASALKEMAAVSRPKEAEPKG